MRVLMSMLVGVSLLLLLGCSEAPVAVDGDRQSVEPQLGADQSSTPTDETTTDGVADSDMDVADGSAAADPASTGEESVERVEAAVGVGKQGQALQGENVNRMIAQPAISFFAAKQRIAFNIQIPDALNKYKAFNDGKLPQSHDEFMEKVINTYNVKLPELPDGHKYEWNPKKGVLEVLKPAG